MKQKTQIILLAILFSSVLGTKIYAQDYKSTVSAGIGTSGVGILLRAVVNDDITGDLSYKTIPVLNVSYEYMLNKTFSVGAGISHQYYKSEDESNGDFVNLTRSNFAIRGLVHYGNSDKVDMYSGLRLGFTKWNLDFDIEDLNNADPTVKAFKNDAEDYMNEKLVFAPQLVAFGMRYFFTDNIGAHGEFAIGAPYFLTFGVNFRF